MANSDKGQLDLAWVGLPTMRKEKIAVKMAFDLDNCSGGHGGQPARVLEYCLSSVTGQRKLIQDIEHNAIQVLISHLIESSCSLKHPREVWESHQARPLKKREKICPAWMQ